ncbi:MAG: hypothetical protein M5U34_36845 [Chloroflexi bacterium]|nr:hypothetical protein [Chloroflexota bacterium]
MASFSLAAWIEPKPTLIGVDKEGGAISDHGLGHLLAKSNIVPTIGVAAQVALNQNAPLLGDA